MAQIGKLHVLEAHTRTHKPLRNTPLSFSPAALRMERPKKFNRPSQD